MLRFTSSFKKIIEIDSFIGEAENTLILSPSEV